MLSTLAASQGERVLVWGDGRATVSLQIAGSGISYGAGNPRNAAVRCPGRQDNDRAELYALLFCLEREPRSLLFITDSKYVHDGITQFRTKWRSRAWFRHPLQAGYMENADLWRQVDTILRKRPVDNVLTCWTRGHARLVQMQAGETSELLCYGNLAADWLAARGAQLRPGQSESCQCIPLHQ